jgi:hypothetical protein
LESKASGILKNVKKPVVLNSDNLDVSLDKEVSESIDKPLFQADKRDVSGVSGQGIKIDASESNKQKEISGQRNFVGDGINFDMNGYFADNEYFTTEQHEYLQNNMFTQNIEAISDQKKKVDTMSFDEIKERLDRDFASKTIRAKIEKNQLIKVDEALTKEDRTADTTINFETSILLQDNCHMLNPFAEEDLSTLLMSIPMESKEEFRGDAPYVEDNFPNLDIGNQDYDYGMNQEMFTDIERNFQPVDQFIGDENVNLELPDQFTESQGSFAERIVELVTKTGKKKDKKFFFSDVVAKFAAERDVADLFYDMMCAGKLGTIHLAQEFAGPIDRKTNLPIIEVSLSS